MRRRLLLLCLALAACGKGEMSVQHKFKPYRPADLFADGAASQTPPPGTVRRGDASDGPPARPAMTHDLLARGQGRFDIYCTPCHGRDGAGTGLVQRRGFPAPPDLTEARLRAAADAHLFDVITHGYGVMYPFGARIPPADTWAIVAYIRALQLSQYAEAAALPGAARAALEAAP